MCKLKYLSVLLSVVYNDKKNPINLMITRVICNENQENCIRIFVFANLYLVIFVNN